MATRPLIITPTPRLQGFVSHYWISRYNTDSGYLVLPDGVVDVVIELADHNSSITAYGTTTYKTELALKAGSHYLGICFKPGQSRHFLDIKPTELTNQCIPAQELMHIDLDQIGEQIGSQRVFSLLNQFLEAHFPQQSHHPSAIDAAILALEASYGTRSISEIARHVGKSLRQFERQFYEIVGLTAKQFATVIRFQRAAQLIAQGQLSLAQVAAELNYTDQSHMHHEFKRLAQLNPSQFRHNPVVFLQ